jgi:aspartate 1-decarboxylase
VIEGEKASGEVTLNGPAARKVQKGDIVIIISYAQINLKEAKSFVPTIIFPDEKTNRLI